MLWSSSHSGQGSEPAWRPRPHDGTRRSLAGEAATRHCVRRRWAVCLVVGSRARILSDPGPPPSEAGATTVIGVGHVDLSPDSEAAPPFQRGGPKDAS
jgi:hypothetical protein